MRRSAPGEAVASFLPLSRLVLTVAPCSQNPPRAWRFSHESEELFLRLSLAIVALAPFRNDPRLVVGRPDEVVVDHPGLHFRREVVPLLGLDRQRNHRISPGVDFDSGR